MSTLLANAVIHRLTKMAERYEGTARHIRASTDLPAAMNHASNLEADAHALHIAIEATKRDMV